MNWWKRAALLLVAGGIVGPLGDMTHVLSQTLAYPETHLLGLLQWWVPPLFGSATVLIGFSHPWADRVLERLTGRDQTRAGERSMLGLFSGMLAFMAMYAASGFLPLETGGARDVVLAAAALLTWACLDRTLEGLVIAVIAALIGVFFEMTLVAHGQFRYLPGSDNWRGVPSWLPWLYVPASIGVGNLGRVLARGGLARRRTR